MNNRNIENGLALIGAIIVLVGVTIAANSALADDTEGARAAAAVRASSAPQARAEKANREAAEHAAASLARDNRLDLEIRLLGRTSPVVARRR